MKQRWLPLATGAAAEALFNDLVQRYTADGRFYHNLAHVQQLLQAVEAVRWAVVDWTAVQWAIWFHDVIYDPRAHDNEAQSAAYAQQQLGLLGVGEAMVTAVVQLILATKVGATGLSHADVPVMQDVDLSVLGSSRLLYAQYARAIRLEYGYVPERLFVHGRGQLLQRFLQQPAIYQTEHFFNTLEAQARRNIAWELQWLVTSATE